MKSLEDIAEWEKQQEEYPRYYQALLDEEKGEIDLIQLDEERELYKNAMIGKKEDALSYLVSMGYSTQESLYAFDVWFR